MAHTNVDIAIVGAGFSGLGMAIRLREQGIDDFLVTYSPQAEIEDYLRRCACENDLC